jgi:hypothetical protein
MAPIRRFVPRLNWKTVMMFLAVLGPGIITANADNDAGGITTYSLAGSQYGYSLLWPQGDGLGFAGLASRGPGQHGG